jgi:hypothetical protein
MIDNRAGEWWPTRPKTASGVAAGASQERGADGDGASDGAEAGAEADGEAPPGVEPERVGHHIHAYIHRSTYIPPPSEPPLFSSTHNTCPTTPHHTAPHRTHRLSAHARVAPPASDHRCDLRAPTIDGADDHRRRRRPRIPLPLDAGRERPPTYTPGPPAVAAAHRASWPRAPSPGGSRQHHRPPPPPP